MPTTAEILARPDGAPLHLKPERDLADAWVSSRSRWFDATWILDNPTPGASTSGSTLQWSIELPDGTRLTDPQHRSLLDALRRFAWSLFADPRAGKALKPGTANHVSLALACLTRWMVGNGYVRLDQLDANASQEFLEDLPTLLSGDDQDDDDEVAESQAWRYLNIWKLLYRQGDALQEAGIAPMPEPPFGGRSTSAVTREVATRARGKIPPLPDEVVLPVLQEAIRRIGTPADDVIRLQDIYLNAYAEGRRGWSTVVPARAAARRAILSFEFATPPGELGPWRPPLQPEVWRTRAKEDVDLTVVQVMRNLIQDTRDAAVLVLQGLVGLRINEVCGLDGSWNEATELPECVSKVPSRTGLHDLYFLKGLLAKTREAPEEVQWILGSTPRAIPGLPLAQAADLPLPVRALIVLERLYRPWRQLGGTDRVIVSFLNRKGLPKAGTSIGPIKAEALRKAQKNFVHDYVDLTSLPDTSARGEDLAIYRNTRGTCLRTHQWRKSFAHYALLTRSSLLPAVSQHFKHLSLAMTEQGYIISDPYLRSAVNDAFAASTASFFYEASTGKRLAGRLGELLAQHREELAKLATGDKETTYRNIARWVATHNLRIFHAEYGKCCIGLRPTEARCHELSGTTSWMNQTPNFAMRAPPICAGCRCFAIDADNAPFWRDRYIENERTYRQAEVAGCADEYPVARERSEQARAILKMIGLDVPEVVQ